MMEMTSRTSPATRARRCHCLESGNMKCETGMDGFIAAPPAAPASPAAHPKQALPGLAPALVYKRQWPSGPLREFDPGDPAFPHIRSRSLEIYSQAARGESDLNLNSGECEIRAERPCRCHRQGGCDRDCRIYRIDPGRARSAQV